MVALETEHFFDWIGDNSSNHSRESDWWKETSANLDAARAALKDKLQSEGELSLGELGLLNFSYIEFGSITSLDLFGLDELILFAFYFRNRSRYSKTADLGANVGLHSLVLAKLGFEVEAYEPDPNHIEIFKDHVRLNQVEDQVTIRAAAVSHEAGEVEFVRVLGNTTGSHIAGAKEHLYGSLDRFRVPSVSIVEAIAGKSLVKMDVEGVEAELLLALEESDFVALDILLEVGSPESAARIWSHFRNSKVNLFSQKIGWQRVQQAEQVPTSYREGSLFLSQREVMPW